MRGRCTHMHACMRAADAYVCKDSAACARACTGSVVFKLPHPPQGLGLTTAVLRNAAVSAVGLNAMGAAAAGGLTRG